ncbi:alpha-L-fucosidase [Streptomyces lasiicapitis]|uniref:alpha-L-fucosidase n=1 Tax=Streptomyces lasiicapitis TaxID=1923961 RepID=UPI00365108BD
MDEEFIEELVSRDQVDGLACDLRRRPVAAAHEAVAESVLDGEMTDHVGYEAQFGEQERWQAARDGEKLESFLHGLNPDLVINNRVGKRRVTDGDYGTPEQEIPAAPADGQLWESCMTLNGTWGYTRHDQNWKSATDLTRNLLTTSSRSGNYLLNIGPDSLGPRWTASRRWEPGCVPRARARLCTALASPASSTSRSGER